MKKKNSFIRLLRQIQSNVTSPSVHVQYDNDKEISELCLAFKNNTTISHLDISKNSAFDHPARLGNEFLSILLSSRSIIYLNLSNNILREIVATELKTNNTLLELVLESTQISDTEAAAIARSLNINKKLMTINLASNQIGNKGATALAESLTTNKTISFVNLSGNSIGDSAVKSLAYRLKSNTTLIALDLSYTPIGDYGAIILADLIKTSKTLIYLNLKALHLIGEHGEKALAEAIQENEIILSLGNLFSCNDIDLNMPIRARLKQNFETFTTNCQRVLADQHLELFELKIIKNQLSCFKLIHFDSDSKFILDRHEELMSKIGSQISELNFLQSLISIFPTSLRASLGTLVNPGSSSSTSNSSPSTSAFKLPGIPENLKITSSIPYNLEDRKSNHLMDEKNLRDHKFPEH
jgi:hypothetical protein